MSIDGPDEPLRLDYSPWEWSDSATPAQRSAMAERLDELRARGCTIGTGCTVSALAVVATERLVLGDRSYVAAHAHLTGDVVLGADCSVNVGVAVRGDVRIGDAVRIGAHTSVLGFNHTFDDPDVPVFRQPLTAEGIAIGDDAWLGAHVVVVDGVRIGSHAVVGAGAVVTRDVPDWAVVVGNPARVVGDRRERGQGEHGRGERGRGEAGRHQHGRGENGRRRGRGTRARLADYAQDARAELPGILERAWVDGTYRDRPDVGPTVRAHCDAIELTDLLLEAPPAQLTRAQHVDRLRTLQDPATGLVAELDGGPGPDRTAAPFPDHTRAYHVLCVGYALDLLGSSFAHPIPAVTALSPRALTDALDRLPWETNAWGAGAIVDAVGTAMTWVDDGGHPAPPTARDALVGWLRAARDPGTGLWGSCAGGLLEPVNGTYRLLRGTFAQWGLATGDDDDHDHDAMVDTMLRRGREVLEAPTTTACDVLDVAHPLWWAGAGPRGTRGARRAQDVDAMARELLELTLRTWVPDGGAPFSTAGTPGLQGTEMWAAITWYLADLLGHAEALGYRPRGVHRPEPRPRRAGS